MFLNRRKAGLVHEEFNLSFCVSVKILENDTVLVCTRKNTKG